MTEVKQISVRQPDGTTVHGEFRLWDESPDNRDAVRLELSFGERTVVADSDVGYFDALCQLRKTIEGEGFRLMCFGASKGVYPSAMSRSMGVGDKAYRLEMGRAAAMKDLVSIFDTDSSVIPTTVAEQRAYFEEWLENLR
jgi:hypothetical protein